MCCVLMKPHHFGAVAALNVQLWVVCLECAKEASSFRCCGCSYCSTVSSLFSVCCVLKKPHHFGAVAALGVQL